MNLFVSGSLMIPEVLDAVVGRRFPFQSGLVRGYAQFRLKNLPEAAMIPFPDTAIEGIVYSEIDEDSLRHLDTFVGAAFSRVEVNVQAENGDWVESEAFVLKMKEKKRLTAQPWDEDDFRQKHLTEFLKAQKQSGTAPSP